MVESLQALLSEELDMCIVFHSSTAALYHTLETRPEVQKVTEDWLTGAITEQDVSSFVAELLEKAEPGVQFPYNTALAALAVAFEGIADGEEDTSFPMAYIVELSNCRYKEMSLCQRVAMWVRMQVNAYSVPDDY